ncbi:hypothetical protein P0W64_16425 [Tsukamurella sp. 8F]|uniref:hypothetical protein n=1 Tax=unclassified Tsukamurella TaxID=2633480 RepID=UPI0023B9B03D|nr:MULTISPECIES: hypothetical protein [unclassified Tsukamurella]MDF0531121.1 hypothetical protein [Tsukamurella sp. 8J]MDF0588367.1 hypothetical protein [Tsukamurella sp. 8F]
MGAYDYLHPGARWTAAEVATQLGIKEDSVADLARSSANFPRPVDRGPNEWRAYDVLAYQITHGRGPRRQPIPRMFPRRPLTAGLPRTSFVEAAVIGEFVALQFEPHDGGGSVAVCYGTDRDHPMPVDQRDADALWLQVQQRLVGVTAVAVVTVSMSPTRSTTDRWAYAPDLAVIEEGRRPTAARWDDLVTRVLELDSLPWWPEALRSADVLGRWQPGSPPLAVIPPGTQAPLVDRLAELADRQPAGSVLRDGVECLRTGLIKAALPDRVCTELLAAATVTIPVYNAYDVDDHLALQPAPTIDARTATALLGARMTADDARDLCAAHDVRGREWDGPLVAVRRHHVADLETTTGLGARWWTRLTEVDLDPTGVEVGYIALARGDGITDLFDGTTRAYRDPLEPASWILATGASVSIGIGDAVPAASGALELSEIARPRHGDGEVLAFLQDSAGVTWPAPTTATQQLNIGYHGGGPLQTAYVFGELAEHGAATRLNGYHYPNDTPGRDLVLGGGTSHLLRGADWLPRT